MDFQIFAAELFQNWAYYIPILLLFAGGYLLIFKKQIWSIFDPLFMGALTKGCAAFAIFVLLINNFVPTKFIISFILIEVCFILGFKIKFHRGIHPRQNHAPPKYNSLTATFGTILEIMTLLIQLYGFKTTGLVIFNEEVNHVSVYDGLGPLRAFLLGARLIFFIYFFYKRKITTLNPFDWIVFILAFIGVISAGSKSSILQPITIFFIVDFYFNRYTGSKIAKIKVVFLLAVISFPVAVIAIRDGGDLSKSLLLLFGRFAGTGDIYVLGYNESVMQHVSDDSFLKYVFYPGWGTILKTIGVDIVPPEGIGVNIFRQYYNTYDAGPNTRLNYLLFFFFGTAIAPIISFLFGVFIRAIREAYGKYKHRLFTFFIITILYINLLSIVSDINIFLNNTFWSIAMFLVAYISAQVVLKVKKYIV